MCLMSFFVVVAAIKTEKLLDPLSSSIPSTSVEESFRRDSSEKEIFNQ